MRILKQIFYQYKSMPGEADETGHVEDPHLHGQGVAITPATPPYPGREVRIITLSPWAAQGAVYSKMGFTYYITHCALEPMR